MWCKARYRQGFSVRLRVCQTRDSVCCDKMNEACTNILTPHERSLILVFRQEEWLVRTTPSTWNFWSNWPCWSENADFQSIFARSTSAVTPSEKVQLTRTRSPLRAFQWAHDEQYTFLQDVLCVIQACNWGGRGCFSPIFCVLFLPFPPPRSCPSNPAKWFRGAQLARENDINFAATRHVPSLSIHQKCLPLLK